MILKESLIGVKKNWKIQSFFHFPHYHFWQHFPLLVALSSTCSFLICFLVALGSWQNLQRVICWSSIAWEVWSCWRSTRDVRAGVWVHLSEAGLHVQLLHLQSAQPELYLGQDRLSTWRLLPLHWSWCCAHVSEERWFSVSCCHSHHQSGGFTLLHNSNWRGAHEIYGLSIPLLWTWSGRV